MKTKTYLITTTYIKENSPLNFNVEDTLINSAIYEAQMIYLVNLLGSDLYDKIISLVTSGDISQPANAVYKSLLDLYITDVVMYYTIVQCLPYIHNKIMNKSVTKQKSENSEPIEAEDLKYFAGSFKNTAEVFGERLIKHLEVNYALYPEYYMNTTCDKIQPTTNSYSCGIVFEKRHRHCDDHNCGCYDCNH